MKTIQRGNESWRRFAPGAQLLLCQTTVVSHAQVTSLQLPGKAIKSLADFSKQQKQTNETVLQKEGILWKHPFVNEPFRYFEDCSN